MTPRLILALSLFALTACPTDPKDDTAPEGDTDTDTDADTDADADADADADTDIQQDPALLGSWSRTIDEGGKSMTVQWTGNADGNCVVAIAEYPDQGIDCTWTGDGSTFAIQDIDCGPDFGTYDYTIASAVVTFTATDDPCSERAMIIEGAWDQLD